MLPEIVKKAIKHHSYSKGSADYSVTELISPPQISYLSDKFKVERNPEDLVWALLGTGLHTAMERAVGVNDLSERRMSIQVGNKTISGQIDLLVKNGEGWDLFDYKLTTTSKIIKGDLSDWEKQLNIYKYISEQNGYQIKSLTILAFLRDWEYQDQIERVESISIPFWKDDKVREYLEKRVELHNNKHNTLCSQEEQWRKPYYACESVGGNVRVFKNLTDAITFCKHHGSYYIYLRWSQPTRCNGFCHVSKYCDQYKSEGNKIISISPRQ